MGDEQVPRRRPLDALVVELATGLIDADAHNVTEVYRSLLRDLAADFGADTCFLRHNDARLDASVLVAEWPPRTGVPDPDPIGVVPFADADPVFASTRDQTTVMIYRPSDQPRPYRERVATASGEPSTTMVSVPLVGEDRTLGVLGFVTFRDQVWTTEEIEAVTAVGAMLAQVHRRVAAENELRRRALHDELTGLLGRRGLTEELRTRLREDEPVAVLFADVDRLSALNDFLGQGMGDRFLRTVADRLSAGLPDAAIARLGGDEFVVVAGVESAADGAALGERVRRTVAEPLSIGDDRVTRTASVGVTVGTGTPYEMLRRADRAALQAKASGGNTVVEYTGGSADDSLSRSGLELTLGDAVASDALILHHRPEVDLRTGRVTAVESSVRWPHPTRGLLGPADLVPVADMSTLAPDLGRWIVDRACRAHAARLARTGRTDLHVHVTLSPVFVCAASFADDVAAAVDRHGIDPGLLRIGVSETGVVDSVARTATALGSIRDLGVRVGLDHVGSGFGSLLHVKRLPLDVLTVDARFARGAVDDAGDRAVLAAVAVIAREMSLDVVAAGVDSADAARALRSLGYVSARGAAVGPWGDEEDTAELLGSDGSGPTP
ncbi:putative bifunctional diguanylate cyclase/phosphodiesterase [Rhodococcoides corynebacterioides]|uniref:EAL domain-containing protein n=1 Tax=Rhodococcoides corynebacterioides TaxID=53972 RepID=A0ABS7P5J5_9NOCA|nr:EAL domain-containing protein [Rhodococcus corynebacterioides]MBY6367286.1 EAL domain-containing protein [Rhodococcus corynebacterioides]MBY6408986.1 EAL domain-containing protein [Rhodococcus corynebacterioides]